MAAEVSDLLSAIITQLVKAIELERSAWSTDSSYDQPLSSVMHMSNQSESKDEYDTLVKTLLQELLRQATEDVSCVSHSVYAAFAIHEMPTARCLSCLDTEQAKRQETDLCLSSGLENQVEALLETLYEKCCMYLQEVRAKAEDDFCPLESLAPSCSNDWTVELIFKDLLDRATRRRKIGFRRQGTDIPKRGQSPGDLKCREQCIASLSTDLHRLLPVWPLVHDELQNIEDIHVEAETDRTRASIFPPASQTSKHASEEFFDEAPAPSQSLPDHTAVFQPKMSSPRYDLSLFPEFCSTSAPALGGSRGQFCESNSILNEGTSDRASKNANNLARRAHALAKLRSPYTRPSRRKPDTVVPASCAMPESPPQPEMEVAAVPPPLNRLKRPFRKHVIAVKSSAPLVNVLADPEPFDENEQTRKMSSDISDGLSGASRPPRNRLRLPLVSRSIISASIADKSVCVQHDQHDSSSGEEFSNETYAATPIKPARLRKTLSTLIKRQSSSSTPDATSVGSWLKESDSSVEVVTEFVCGPPNKIRESVVDVPVETSEIGYNLSSSYQTRPLQSKRVCLPVKSPSERTLGGPFGADMPEKMNIGWETASGSKIHIDHDPALAAEWNTPMTALTSCLSTCSETLVRSRKIPLKRSEVADPEFKSLMGEQLALQKEVDEMKELVKQAESALKCQNRQEESKLQRLIHKWREAAQLACDEIFAYTKERIDRAGGLIKWQQAQQWSKWHNSTYKPAVATDDDDLYGLTAEEEEAMGVGEEAFSMRHLLSSMGIPHALIKWDPDLCAWS